MKIEIGRFSDGRLKVIKNYNRQSDSNIRVDDNSVDIVPRNAEATLENDVLEAANLWNLMFSHPTLRDAINKVIKQYVDFMGKNRYGYIH